MVGPLTINPTPSTFNQALLVNQSSPSSGSVPGSFYFNGLFSSFSTQVTGVGAPGATGCACVSGLQVSMGTGGANLSAIELYTGAFGMVHTSDDTSSSDKVGLSAGFYSNHVSPGNLYGGASGGTVDSGGSTPNAIGHEVDMSISGTGVATNRIAMNLVNQGAGQATGNDTAIGISGYPATGAFKTFVTFFSGSTTSANVPLTTTADLFMSRYAMTIANVFNMSNVTVTGNILNFPGAVLTGNGKLIAAATDLYSAAPTAPAGHITYGGTTAASSNCGTLAGSAGCLVINVAGTQRYVPFY